MKRVYKNKEKRNLRPGEFHDFLILKSIILPDNKEYYILVDPFGEKHLLPAIYYKHYQLVLNSKYKCHVDKINCQGRIFLEPVHPYYKPGKIYSFKLIESVTLLSGKGLKRNYFKFVGETGEMAFLPNNNINLDFSKLMYNCKIVKIKKAEIFIEFA